MSLEQAIQENTAAIRDLIAQLKAGVGAADPHAEDDAYRRGMQAARDEVRDAAVDARQEPAKVVKPAEKPAPQAEPKPAAPAAGGDLRKEVRDLVFRLDKEVSRSAALEVLKKGGAARVSELADDKLQLVKEATEALLEKNVGAGA